MRPVDMEAMIEIELPGGRLQLPMTADGRADLSGIPLSQAQIGRIYGITRVRVDQHEKRALAKLATRIGARALAAEYGLPLPALAKPYRRPKAWKRHQKILGRILRLSAARDCATCGRKTCNRSGVCVVCLDGVG